MNTPETINIEKYAEALNNLVGMDIGYLGESDKDVNAIVEVIRAAKALENRVKELEAEIRGYSVAQKFDAEYYGKDIKKLEKENEELRNILDNALDKYRNCEHKVAIEIFEDIENVFEPTVSALFLISETLVDVSKSHIDADRAIIDIRKYLSKAICSRYQLKKALEESRKKYIGEDDNE